MSEWSTYTLSDFLMFSPRTWWRLVEAYNREWWPLHIAMFVAGIAAVWRARFAPWVLAAAWAWVAWAFHWERHVEVNLAGPWFAGAFALQAALLLASPRESASRVGLGVAAAGLVLYPLVGVVSGKPVEVFGMMPDPTALVTLGLVRRWWLRVIPALALTAGWLTRWVMAG
ncbi:MAG: hypothetical protein HY854_00265 [Burkholderiales bacterium]|nr:hypothetical protein [Burkholderiales bacterium]